METTKVPMMQEVPEPKVETQRSRYERRRPPMLIDLSGGQPVHDIQSQYRSISIIISGTPGDTLALVYGARRLWHVTNVGGDPVSIPFPYVFNQGMQMTVINVTTPLDLTFNFHMFVYTA